MYETYWRLAHRPFDAALDATAYYPSQMHQSVLLKLRYAVEQGLGAALVVGDAGTGKSMLVRLLETRAASTLGPWAWITYPQLAPHELLHAIAVELTGIDEPEQVSP